MSTGASSARSARALLRPIPPGRGRRSLAARGQDFDALYEAWDARIVDLRWRPDRTFGAICRRHEGRAYRDWLVVSGPERGTVWSDPRTDQQDLAPTGTTFGAWYLNWLAEQEAALRRA